MLDSFLPNPDTIVRNFVDNITILNTLDAIGDKDTKIIKIQKLSSKAKAGSWVVWTMGLPYGVHDDYPY